MHTCSKDHNYTLIERRHNVKFCQMTLTSWSAPGTLYICCRSSHSDESFILICLKLFNFVRYELILNM